jgi:DNA-binding GntR family transcriptional regulator
MSLPQIRPITTKDRVVEWIKKAIITKKLKAGERVVELQLAKQLGLGTTSIREALFDLERQGYVVRVTNKGAYVTDLSLEDVHQIYLVRVELEGLAVSLLKEYAKQSDYAQLQKIVDKMKSAAKQGEISTFFHNDLEFHSSLWQLSRNKYIVRTLDSMVRPLFTFYLTGLQRTREQMITDAARHQEILDAIVTQDAPTARKVLEETLNKFLLWVE